MRKRCLQNPDIRFYPYQAFEELLLNSPLVRHLGKRCSLDAFNCLSLEKYYEAVLEDITKGSYLEYHHGKCLPDAFLDKNNINDVFNSSVGHVLLDIIIGSTDNIIDKMSLF